MPADASSGRAEPRSGMRSSILGMERAGVSSGIWPDSACPVPSPPGLMSRMRTSSGCPSRPSATCRPWVWWDARRDRSFRARFHGWFRMKPGQAWMPYESRQYDAMDPVTRVVDMRIDAAGVLPMFGTDTYLAGKGLMRGKVLGLFTVVDGEGPEFDLGELVTYLNDAAMLAPSMLLAPNVQWLPNDPGSFDVTITDRGNTVTARLSVDSTGRLIDFRTDDRWYSGTTSPRRTTWSTPIDGWATLAGGRPVPTGGSAIWHLPDGEFSYVRGSFDPLSVEFDTGGA